MKETLTTLKSVPSTVWGLGLVTLCMNASTIIIFSLSPSYLTSVLGMNMLALGLLEGCIEFISWLTRIISGVLSDSMHKRKPILIFAYVLAAASRLVFPLVPNAGWVVGARFADRVSNGLQASPREALVGDVAPSHLKGTCYGLRQTLGLIGSFAGALGLMYLLQGFGHNYTLAFWVAVIPALIGVIVLMVSVHDSTVRRESTQPGASNAPPVNQRLSWAMLKTCCYEVRYLKRPYWSVVAIASLFTLGNYSGAFMLLQAERAGLSLTEVPLVMVIQNLAAFLVAFPIGRLSDRIGRNRLLGMGLGTVIAADLFLALGTTPLPVLIGVALWGLQMGINQSLLIVKVADTTPATLRGTSFGIYYFASALALFFSNLSAGWLSHHWSSISVFYMSAICAGLALISLMLLGNENDQKIGN